MRYKYRIIFNEKQLKIKAKNDIELNHISFINKIDLNRLTK